jgi:membrane-bound lytic murein transglycosylase B
MARQLSRMQKASVLVPMAVLLGVWGAAVTSSGLATAADGSDADVIPDVASDAFDQPATMQGTPGGIDPRAGADGVVSTLSSNGIPSAALSAYRRAETLLSEADKSCRLPWNLVAAIGRVESNHGRSNGNALSAEGLAQPGIYGVPLNGNGVAKISDTDKGAFDKDTVWDRAVGPMQFIPGTWSSAGVDSDNDGKKNPQDIDDAATAAGIYLCAGSGDLSTDPGARSAVHGYNHSDPYVDLVMRISEAYGNGDFSQSPDGYPSSSIITSQSNDQTLSPKQRASAKQKQKTADKQSNGGSSRPGTPKPEPTSKPPAPFDTETYTEDIEALYIETNGRPITESCDAELTTWQCHYDGIKALSESRLDILLTAPADITVQQAEDMSQQARLAWFTVVGGEFPELDTIVTIVNGTETGTTNRADVPMLNQ